MLVVFDSCGSSEQPPINLSERVEGEVGPGNPSPRLAIGTGSYVENQTVG